MDVDDEFGDLYTDIGPEIGKNLTAEPLAGEGVGDPSDEDDEELLYGISSSSPIALSSKPPSLPASTPRRSAVQLALAAKEVDNDELLLYGQLYGVSTEKPIKAKSPSRNVDVKTISVPRVEKREDSREDAGSLRIAVENAFDLHAETNSAGNVPGIGAERPLGVFSIAACSGESVPENDGVTSHSGMLDGFENLALPSDSNALRHPLLSEATRLRNSAPGISTGTYVQQEFVTEEEVEGKEIVEDWEGRAIKEGQEEGIEGEGEDWDSDSEDDIQIVLNDESPMYMGERPADADEVEGSDDEDEEDLVIVTGDDEALPIEEQEWEEQPIPADAVPGALGAALSLGSDRVPGGEDRGQGGKGFGGPGVSPGVPRIGYSGQGYHAHHMQYKYVRPGAGVASGTASLLSQGLPQAGVLSGKGIAGGSLGAWGAGRGITGRGEWGGGGGGRSSAGQRLLQGSGGMASWGASRGFSSGIEFNLPPTKTVFDVDLDSLDEKAWRRPGVDITDYFNFSFTENSWKQYCRQLAQLRLEATMQSKIRVYESGRSEQDYDPDLPPELAAMTGMQEAYADPNYPQQRQQDGSLGAGYGRGRGLGRGRIMPPAGRAIQVEGGGGERRPSADVRRQRSRDSDAILLQDASEDETLTTVPENEGIEEFEEDDEERAGIAREKEQSYYRPGAPVPWEVDGPPNMWERENMLMRLSPIPNMMGPHGGGMMTGHRMDAEGPGPFPVGPGMPMHQSGPPPIFGMFPGTPFGPALARRPGMVRPSLYNTPRPGLPLPVSVPPPESFPPMMVPLEYHKPPRRRTPPRSTPPGIAPPQGHPIHWDDELSNGSGAIWKMREGQSPRDTKVFNGGNDDWYVDDLERQENNYPTRRGRETDRSSLPERGVGEVSGEGRLEEHKRSISRERYVEDNDWDGSQGIRFAKKQKVQPQVDIRMKAVKEDYNRSRALKSNVKKEEPTHSWELPMKEQVAQEEDLSKHRKHDAINSKATESKGPSLVEDSLSSQRKELSWNDRQGEELKDRRLPREREEVQHRKLKEDNYLQHRSREDLEWERRRELQERKRRHLKKDKEEENILRDNRNRMRVEDHMWSAFEREEGHAEEDVKSVSAERGPEFRKEKQKNEEDLSKLKSRQDDFRETDGRLKRQLENLRESDGRRKGKLEGYRENDGRLKGRLEDVREIDVRVKGRLEDVREIDGRVKEELEDVRQNDGVKVKGPVEDGREGDGRAKGRLDDIRVSEGRVKGRFEGVKESDGRAKGWLENLRESNARGKSRFEDISETDGRARGRLDNFKDNDGRVKARLDDYRESDARIKVQILDLRESEVRTKGWSEDLRGSNGRGKGSLEGGRAKGWLEDVRQTDGRGKRQMDALWESDGKVKGRLDDSRGGDVRVKERLEDSKESAERRKVRSEEGRESDGKGRRYDKEDDMYAWDDRRKYEEKEVRESDGKGRRYDKEDDMHAWGDWRKYEEKSTHADRNHNGELRKIREEQRPHKDRRGWEGSVTAKLTLTERNGSLLGIGEDKNYRSHMEGSKKRRVEEYRTSAQFDKASARNSDDLAAMSARHKEKKVAVQKRMEDHLARWTHGKDITSSQHHMSKDDNVLENGSSGEEADRRGQSKLDRWTRRKDQDAIAAMEVETMQKGQNSEAGREEAPSSSQRATSERKHQYQSEQLWKEERKKKQRLTVHSTKRHESVVKEYDGIHGGGIQNTTLEPPPAASKDAAEKRKERLERLRLQAEEVAARRQKKEPLVLQAGSVDEVKQERPARKRRWGNG